MAELVYFTGPMDCGKSTLALQLDYSHTAGGRHGIVCTSQDRAGEATISSRLGLERPALEVTADLDFWAFVGRLRATGEPLDYLIGDEAQFYSTDQVEQLARLVDECDIDVFAFGILTDFQTGLFPGSQRLVELSDRIETLPLPVFCWCGRQATHNARTLDGHLVRQGSQVMLGDTTSEDLATTSYEVLCRRHHRLGQTRTDHETQEQR